MLRSAQHLLSDMNEIWDGADRANRDLTYAERSEVEGLLSQIKAQQRLEHLGRELGGGMTNKFSDPNARFGGGGRPGDVSSSRLGGGGSLTRPRGASSGRAALSRSALI